MKAILYEKLKTEESGNAVLCKLCSHYCVIQDGKAGTCRTRENRGGNLFAMSWGQAEGTAMDPIEKKPFFHFKPQTSVLSFGAPGCNFKCLNCQNSSLSQTVKYNREGVLRNILLTPEEIVRTAIRRGADGIAYTYSEPTIFFEYLRDTVLESRKFEESSNFFHVFVSNGYFSKEMFELVIKEKLLAAMNIDLKFMNDKKYNHITGGRLAPVLENIKRVWDNRGALHLEIINLIIPGENDDDDDFKKISEFIASVSTEIPLHFNRFHPCYEMPDKPPTPIERLLAARDTAKLFGIKYVYIGNTGISGAENTYCPNCNSLIVARSGFGVLENRLANDSNNKAVCPDCGAGLNFVL